MAGEEAPESSRSRRRMDLNLPPRPRPRVRGLGTSAASATLAPNSNSNSAGAAPEPEAPRTGEPEEPLAPAPAVAVAAVEPEPEPECVCNSRFECYICLAVAKEPVVTTCGHLFCWPCLYRWIYPQLPFCECPVCKGELLKGNITPIYGRGSDEGDDDSAANAIPGFPPRPPANRRASLRRRLQMAGASGDTRAIESMVMELLQNPGIVGGLAPPAPAPAPAGAELASVPAAPRGQPSSSVEQPSTSRAAAVIVDEPGPSRRRTRRKPSRYRSSHSLQQKPTDLVKKKTLQTMLMPQC